MTATRERVDLPGGLVILGPGPTALLQELERTFTGWGLDAGAAQIAPPPVFPVAELERFDVYDNFPHLNLVAGPLDLTDGTGPPTAGGFDNDRLSQARWGLPHATCYGAYLFHAGTEVPGDTLVTLVNRCFRNEEHYDGLRRLLSFQMREIVALGSFAHTQRVIAEFTERIQRFAEALDLKLDRVAASDPFFQQDGGRALLQRLSPVKHEFVSGDLAIASVNTHRNFFGERCDIRLAGSGEHASTGCVAFGLERWLSVLLDQHGDDADRAAQAVRAAARRVS
ncbi:hypothetical protein [Streptomyces marincola]|uniref:Aminoacyl-transfer RNA synthetases class-II family profile domain-containing protein n=1 Tax=Streptomyces marincola TaxID=2878388 RepID=A0A1W7CUP2_9ACTN|nr:hypothetical protein [Streptomyces marincola]ARQ68475.1 hypothetical protein CAG99_06055 [Streptomyces marincola]